MPTITAARNLANNRAVLAGWLEFSSAAAIPSSKRANAGSGAIDGRRGTAVTRDSIPANQPTSTRAPRLRLQGKSR